MSKRLLLVLTAATLGTLFCSSSMTAQILPPEKRAARVNILQEPMLELAYYDVAIVRWTTNNPGGSDDHFGVVYYGTDPKELRQQAKSQIRLNRAHPDTVFRVRISGLKPRTTYYYRVTSEESNGASDGVNSSVSKFTMPGPGERFIADLPRTASRPK